MSNADIPKAAPTIIDTGPASIFAALGDRTRLSLLTKLSDGRPRSIADLSLDAEITRQAVTKHLHVLEQAGLVSSSRRGRESHFTFRGEPIAEMRNYLESVSRQWDDALSRLRAFVEK
ncbi:ArsR family transcriptional regulator [Neorhizobium sp. P12A]|uniref:ArsR/SmtB family transcription factor n=1 Tax=Neorhizobium sp. P12A TaxID=2268027 RepID=UPI0011EBD760|nr:metalloregulator ArsR/SmtB family transcription factor [Neorhizobium sp. P12A]KAA0697669.1 ArsR family transcriptional regulator [Neorhizobium sp. P12A]